MAEHGLDEVVRLDLDPEGAERGDGHRRPRPAAAVGDLHGDGATVRQRRHLHTLGTVLGQQARHPLHQSGDVALRATDHLGMPRHGPLHLVAIDSQSAHGPGQTDQRQDGRRCPTAVDADGGHRAGVRPEVVEDQTLDGVVGVAVPPRRPPVVHRGRQHPRMLAAAVVGDRGRPAPVPHDGAHRRRLERQRRRVVEVVVAQSGAGEDLAHRRDVLGATVVAGTHHGQQAIVQRQPGRHHRRRLQRLQRRAREDPDVRVTHGPRQRAVRGEGDDGAVVHALEDAASPHLGHGCVAASHLRARRIFAHRFHTRG